MLKPLRVICALIFSCSVVVPSPFSNFFTYCHNVSKSRNVPVFRLSLREDEIGMPILFNQTLDYMIPRRRLLDDISTNTNNSLNSEISRKMDGFVDSNTSIDFDKDTEKDRSLPIVSINMESLPNNGERENNMAHVRAKRSALIDQNLSKYEEASSTDNENELSNVQNARNVEEDDELDDYNVLNEKSSSSVEDEESKENDGKLREEVFPEESETDSRSIDSKMKRESADYEYLEDQEENIPDGVKENKMAGDVRVKREEGDSVKRIKDDVRTEDNSINVEKKRELNNLDTDSKEEEISGSSVEVKVTDDGVSALSSENRNSDDKKTNLKREVSTNKTDSSESLKEVVSSVNNEKDVVGKAVVSSELEVPTAVDRKSEEGAEGARVAPKINDDYEKRVEDQIKRKIDSIKEEIKREIERKQRDREIERNNAKFDELQNNESEEEEDQEGDSEGVQSFEEKAPLKRSLEIDKRIRERGKRKRRSNENEMAEHRSEEIDAREDNRLVGSTSDQTIKKKRFAPIQGVPSSQLEKSSRIDRSKAPVKKREKVRQMFIVKDDGERKRKKRGKKARREVPKGTGMLIPEQARVKIVEELPRDLTLDPRLRRSLPFRKKKQVRSKRESRGLEPSRGWPVPEYRPLNIEDEENDEGNEFGDGGFEDRTSNLRDRSSNSLTYDRSYEERDEDEANDRRNFLFPGVHSWSP